MSELTPRLPNHQPTLAENLEQPVPTLDSPRQPLVFDRLDVVFALLMLGLGYLCIKLVFGGRLGLGASVFGLITAPCLAVWFKLRKQKIAPTAYLYLALVLTTGLYFGLYENPVLKPLALLLMLLLAIYFVLAAGSLRLGQRLDGYLLLDLWDGLCLPFHHLGAAPRILTAQVKRTKNGKSVLLVLLGVVVALPIFAYLCGQLIRADVAFGNLWQQLSNRFLEDVLVNGLQFILGIPIACYLFALLYGEKLQAGQPYRSLESAQTLKEKAHFLPGLLALGFITPILVLYLLFFCSQTAYFLSAFSGLLPEGYSYAAYARQGFFELCRVSGINFGLILLLMFLTKKGPGKNLAYRIYTILLAVFSLALVVISLSKMLLYIQSYGLTPLRLYTSWFMLVLAILFCFVILKTLLPRFAGAKRSALVTVLLFLILCFADPQAQIARYNVEGYAAGRLEDLDVELLSDLGASATPYLLEVMELEAASDADRQAARCYLQHQLYEQEEYSRSWYEYTLSQWRSENYLQEHAAQIGPATPLWESASPDRV